MNFETQNPVFKKFCELMSGFGYFEEDPVIAVAVSGGSDSMALVLLAEGWVKRFGGKVIALSVDHRIRKESASEIEQVGKWLARYRIEHHVLNWVREKRKISQNSARLARYQLLETLCREKSILHLLLGHTAGDQLETMVMRFKNNSGPDGLAGMSALVEKTDCRFLRPLLSCSRSELRSFLIDQGQKWVEDPSNENTCYERVRIRQEVLKKNFSEKKFQSISKNFAEVRLKKEHEIARIIASLFSLNPTGFGFINKAKFLALPDHLIISILGQLIRTIGGLDYPPPHSKVDRILSSLIKGSVKGQSLGRCKFSDCDQNFLLMREIRNLPQPIRVFKSQKIFWDRRFLLRFSDSGKPAVLRSFRRADLKKIFQPLYCSLEKKGFIEVLQTLPALYTGEEFLSLPAFGYTTEIRENRRSPAIINFHTAVFKPRNSLSGSGFHLIKERKILDM